MEKNKIKICILRVGGTNRDVDIANCFADLGIDAKVLHLNDILRRQKLSIYSGLVIPGGFAFGDYVRAGAIWGKKLHSLLGRDLELFKEQGKPILGICNGFQVLVEAGLIPGLDGVGRETHVTLTNNKSAKFECRWVRMRKNLKTRCLFVKYLPEYVRFPIAHGEGRFVIASDSVRNQIVENRQIVLQFVKSNGRLADGSYPDNPNGSDFDIAGICDNGGTVLGLMPHPEDAYFGYQLPDWTSETVLPRYGDGFGLVNSMVKYIEECL